jgi:hypothetical protein
MFKTTLSYPAVHIHTREVVLRVDWPAVDLEAGCLRVLRSWDHRGAKFVEPKTAAGVRVVPLSRWLLSGRSGQGCERSTYTRCGPTFASLGRTAGESALM